jgi:hypothetical protein
LLLRFRRAYDGEHGDGSGNDDLRKAVSRFADSLRRPGNGQSLFGHCFLPIQHQQGTARVEGEPEIKTPIGVENHIFEM